VIYLFSRYTRVMCHVPRNRVVNIGLNITDRAQSMSSRMCDQKPIISE